MDQFQSVLVHVSLGIGLLLSIRSIFGFFTGVKYRQADTIFAVLFLCLLYLQLGIIAYIFKTQSFNYEASVRAIEHAALTLFATILTQSSNLITKRAQDDAVKFRFKSILYSLATGLLGYAYIIMFQLTR
ncbi:MAG: hypothetical protein AAF616_11820 [Bacteroidota bacterium]